ncbi:MAG: right-handed parallel beta-helix repeat-containing protein [Victivallales bacterium]|nr:right-handed parallel beta-helix repeat-containing protein [Victivallales bacterium]
MPMQHVLRSVVGLFLVGLPTLAAATFVVAPDGDDGNTGSGRQPFATVVRAQRAVRELKRAAGLQEPITVTIKGGVYRLARPLVFTPADSGSAACPVTYRAARGATVVLSGGRKVTGLVQEGPLWTTVLEPGWRFNQLYVNGRRRVRARTPNHRRYLRTRSALPGKQSRSGFHFGKGDLVAWPDVHEAVVVVYASWYNTIHHIRELDEATRTVLLTNPAGRPFDWYERNLRYYVENVAAALDEPGEWHVAEDGGKLRYYPLPGETLAGTSLVAPVVRQTLVRFQGDFKSGLPVEHIRLQGLQIRHTDAFLPPGLYDARQAATVQEAGIVADHARHITIERCEVANMGEHGIWFRDNCHHCVVRQCHVHDLGGGGVYIGEKWRWGKGGPGWPGYEAPGDVPHATEHNVVDNCFVHDGCHMFTGALGIWVGQAAHTTVSHNHISNMSYSGISVGWDWSGRPSTSHHNLIEKNHIHHIGHGRMNDLAGIYTLGVSPGTVLRQNLIHDVNAYQSPVGYSLGAGIYLDQSSSEILVEDNVCHDIQNAGFFLHYGRNNQVRNNVFAQLAGLGRLGWGMDFAARPGQADNGNVATENIVYGCRGRVAKVTRKKGKDGKADPPFLTLDRNLYWDSRDAPLQFSLDHGDAPDALVAFPAWQATGKDSHSAIADPKFRDPDSHDYRLTPESPAHALGIRSIDVSEVGLYGDVAWTGLPATTAVRPPDVAEPFSVMQGLVLRENYEEWPVGHVPVQANFVDRAKGALVEVTERQAADGARCLRFVDVPGLAQSYHPNRTWRNLRVATGSVRIVFDFLNDAKQPGTCWFELRDWSKKPYQAGPSMTFRPEGKLGLGADRELPYALGQWYHIEMALELGEGVPRQYTLRFGPKGEVGQELRLPWVSKEFEILTWIGFVALDKDRHSQFYIDNLVIDANP